MTEARSIRSMRSTSRPVADRRPASRFSSLTALVRRPDRPRIACAELGGQARQRRRREGLGEDRKAGATIRGMSLGQLPPGRHEIVPGLRLPFQPDRLRPVGIVQAEHGRLDEGVRGPEGRGVRRVSLDLGRSPFVALDDQAVGAPAERHGRRVVARDPRDDLLGSGDKGDDFFDWTPAPGDTRERQRGAQERHHLAPGDPFGKLRGSLRELPLDERRGIRGAPRAARDFANTSVSPVAPRTVSRRIDRSVACKLRREQLDVPGRGPLHVGDF